MSRPHKNRWVCDYRTGLFFKMRGIPLSRCEVINLQFDELEALRQADIMGKTQEEGAQAMGISRSTFGRILEQAHGKTARALVEHCALKIEGGPVIMKSRNFKCRECGHQWGEPFGAGRPHSCPECKSRNIFRLDPGPPHGGSRRRRAGCRYNSGFSGGNRGGRQGED